jgi:hypothetical protein
MIMNSQYSRVGRTYPKIGNALTATKSNSDSSSFSILEVNTTIQNPTVGRLLTK